VLLALWGCGAVVGISGGSGYVAAPGLVKPKIGLHTSWVKKLKKEGV